jgi:lipopolysaccharide heptosyltransferase II
LVVRCDHIGDAAMATAVLRPLREALRPATLDVLAAPWSAELFESHPMVDNVLSFATPWWSAVRGASWRDRMVQWRRVPGLIGRIRAGRYDVGIDLRGDLRQIAFFLAFGGMPVRVSSDRTGGRRLLTHTWPFDASQHEVRKNFAVAALLGAMGQPSLDLAASVDTPAALRSALGGSGPLREYVVFALRGSAPNKSWPATHAAVLANLLERRLGLRSVVIGGAADERFGEEVVRAADGRAINLAGRTSLTETLSILRDATLTIAVDSGPMHLAVAVGTPVVSLFGPTDPEIFGPWSDRPTVVSVGAPCGCVDKRCDFVGGAGQCMRKIEPRHVLEAVCALLERAPSTRA